MSQADGKILSGELAAIISCSMLGIGMLTLPRTITEKIHSTDGWIVLIFNGIIIALFISLLVVMLKKHKVADYYTYMEEAYGKWLSKIIGMIVVLYFIGVASFEVLAMSEMVRFYLLEETPVEILILSMILASVHLLTGKIKAIAKACVFFLPLTIVIVLLIYLFSLRVVDLKNLQPVLAKGFLPVIKGMGSGTLSFFGIELFIFLFGVVKNQNKIRNGVLIGFFIPLILYVITYILVVATLTVPEVIAVTWPTISFIQSFEVTGIFLERMELFLLITWILQFFLTNAIYYYFAAEGMTKIFSNSYTTNLIVLLPIIFFLAKIPKNTNEIFKMSDLLGYIFPFVLFGLPIITFAIVQVKRSRRSG
ncbi:spore gernimation protein [Bacillus sp. Soil745]|uniref:GerAB/ArcD/ProY family transporter n=1 Tax=Peribacillus frigoritolerans TaxID=450367 RepID=UPI000710B3DC|nr:GerAB/ArcD/ProY family transporter [Peribacillus frigoritolerans]KRF52023.1 spore gernimation protein [Bacillus sp. Soil745]MED3710147.1 GerAB/ArcD/ProY family transporter [Peribacillus frigoritolerans]PAW30558.1 spore gernimation protein [Peribacillus simplex]